jgi:Ras-related protein Rab-1A
MVSSSNDIIYKILLLGDSSVGKTCLLLRYVEDTYTANHISTIGVDYKMKLVSTNDNKVIKLQIWDTAGQDRFRCITKNYYRGSNGIMLIYDITSTSSFQNIKNWITQIKDYLGDDACITLVGNKIDLESNRRVSTEEGRKLATENNFNFFEASAKDNINISEAFENLTKEMLKKNNVNDEKTRNSKTLNKKENTNKKKCCE